MRIGRPTSKEVDVTWGGLGRLKEVEPCDELSFDMLRFFTHIFTHVGGAKAI